MDRSIRCMFVLATLTTAATGQTVTGVIFEDVNRNGVQDFGEPVLANVPITLYGNDGLDDIPTTSAADGSYSFTVTVGAPYALDVQPGADLRMSFQDLGADPDPIPDWPQGRRRPGVLDHLVSNLRGSSSTSPFLHVALGDSIAYGYNLCGSPDGRDDYVTPFTARLDLVGPNAVLSKLAMLGYETKDLLDPTVSGSVFDAVNAQAHLVSISIATNDFRKDDGDDARTAANLVAMRKNLQEILSTLLSQLPQCDVVLDTVYDNLGGNDSFHNKWWPIWNQVLRDVAWGQTRRVGIAEIWPDYEHLDPATGTKLGQSKLICQAGGDGLHPKRSGYDLHEEKLWQGVGAIDVVTGVSVRNFGWAQRIETRFPTQYNDLGGGAQSETDAFQQDDVGAIIPAGDQELRLFGFDATPRGLLEQVVVHVRYRTSAPPTDDVYRFEASVDGSFSSPGSDDQSWNTVVPIVGGAGNHVPVLAYSDQPAWRDVSALVTKGSLIDGSPSLTWQDLSTLTVRLIGSATGSPDAFNLEWDVASIDLYGVPSYRLLVRGDPRLGGSIQIDATGKEGAQDLLFASTGIGSFPFPPWGTFLLDLSQFALVGCGAIGSTGAHTITGTIPNDPGLVGLTVYFQSLVIEDLANRIGALTNVASITFQ